MRTPQSIYSKLGNLYKVPPKVVEVICNSPFKFAKEAMSNFTDKPIRLQYLGKFKLKKKYEQKEDTVER